MWFLMWDILVFGIFWADYEGYGGNNVVIWIADPLMSTKEKKWRAFGVNCGFYREKKHGLEFFFGLFRGNFEWAQWAHL